jgi:pimeloyl-ACP methyl ester carboxylesterase
MGEWKNVFEQIGIKNFVNREQTGTYADVEFDTYVTNKGRDEVLGVSARIHYYEAGEGDDLVLVHGIGQTSYTWRKNFDELSKYFHVYAIDLPGHGFSGKPEISYSIEEFALSIEAFMNARKLVSASFCAFGEAAVYVLDFAIHNPERAKGVILVSPVISGGSGFRGRGMECVFGGMAGRGRLTVPNMRAVLEDCYFDRTLVTDETAREYIHGISDRDYRIIARMCMNNFLDDGVVANLGSIKSPILIIVGNDDKITGGKDSDFLDLGFGNGSFLTVRNCGYLVQEEKPEKVNEAVVTFLGAK